MTASSGEVELCLPAQWTDVVLSPDGEDPDTTLRDLVAATWPAGPADRWDAALEVLRSWRDTLRSEGVVSHGLVSGPRADGTIASWQVMTSVTALPAEPDVDLRTLLTGLIQAEGRDLLQVEPFPTELGLGLGLVALPELQPPGDLDRIAALGFPARQEPVTVGVAAAVAWAQGAAEALVVVGLCVEPAQVLELAGVVALVAGRSRLRPDPIPADETGA